MRAHVKILALGTLTVAASLSLSGVATSQTAPASNAYLNNQVQLGDVVAGQTLNVQDAPGGTSAVTTAVGNDVTAAGVDAPLSFQSRQTLKGAVSATTNATVTYDSTPYYVTSTSATGNSATASTCCATVSGSSTQTIRGQGVGAVSNVFLGGYSAAVSADSTAVGNTQGWNTAYGEVNATSQQSSTGGVTAATSANIHAADSASYTATAVANDVETNATSSPVILGVTQKQAGVTQAITDVNTAYGGDSVATSSAVANNNNVYSDSYGDSVASTQTNSGAVNALSEQTLGTWYGTAASTAYGVGNSTLVSNAGSYTGVTSDQTNSADITVSANVYGNGSLGDGGNALSSATGVGNAVSAYACASCDGTISAHNKQVNSGSVKVSSSLTASGLSGQASGVSSAIGNTATYQVVSSGNN